MFNGSSAAKIISCKSPNNLPTVAEEIIKEAGEVTVWLFEGEMGAGKTTLIKAICEVFNVVDVVNSPTFSLVNEYQDSNGRIFYHFDFYRIKSETEAMDIGCDEYFYSGEVCLIEWPSKIPNLIPDAYLTINIEVNPDQSRRIALYKNG